MQEQEIIIHKNQSTLDDYLKEENTKCNMCRWCLSLEVECTNKASYFSELGNLTYVDTSDCEQYYPNNDKEIFEKTIDEDSERIEF